MTDTPRVLLCHDSDGRDYIVADHPVEVIEIDERAPHDRAYRRAVEILSPAVLDVLIGDSPIGHAGDARHRAIAARLDGTHVRLAAPPDETA